MSTVVILGAGEHGATLARRLAGRELARRIVLVDSDEGRARGKALDILQSGPVDRFDTRVDGASDPGSIDEPDILVVADAPELTEGPGAADRLAQLVVKTKPRLVVVAGARPAASVDGVLATGFAADRVVGSAPVAVASAIRRRLAAALDVEPSAVCLALLGLPPDVIVVPHASAAVGGVPIEQLRPAALRQAVQEVGGRTPGPVALAAAAVHVIAALLSQHSSVLPVLARATPPSASGGRRSRCRVGLRLARRRDAEVALAP